MISSERAWGRRLGTTSTLLWWVLCGRLARHGCPSQVATRAEQELLSAARRARLGSVWQPKACVYWRTRRRRPELASLGTLHGRSDFRGEETYMENSLEGHSSYRPRSEQDGFFKRPQKSAKKAANNCLRPL
jgi:hypothetical protein